MAEKQLSQALQLIPEYRDYVWGGSRLRPGIVPTAEAWVVYENDRVASGPFAGQTLAGLAERYGGRLLGEPVVQRTGTRFPVLVKLLDCAQWLSLQVHPNDEQAARLEGPGFFGKTEAWHVLEAAPQAELIAGIKPGVTPEAAADAIRSGRILDLSQRLPVQAGDTIFMRPGTLHALGPGLLIYEVQQTSDLTYRVWDWDRPQTGRRVLHIDKSLEVVDPSARASALALPAGARSLLVQCPYFSLETLSLGPQPLELDTAGQSFHALTVIEGSAVLQAEGELALQRFETAIVPAEAGRYRLVGQGYHCPDGQGNARVLKATGGPFA